ncbi:MAG: stage III sporulation protein AC [Clostridia bacterium]|jgi:stage III sporulation protein AC|nr:stage III sporulation protein AC [Clostridia bacterium]MBQ9507386.1 stage III sporulation protein AC [Clostridia bacterium]MBR5422491.1 stage III sporulation protein AC [Clostridia bacterium]
MDIEIIFRIAAVGLIVAVLNQVLSRSGKEEYTMLVTLAGLIAALMLVIPYISTLFGYVRSVFGL